MKNHEEKIKNFLLENKYGQVKITAICEDEGYMRGIGIVKDSFIKHLFYIEPSYDGDKISKFTIERILEKRSGATDYEMIGILYINEQSEA